MICGRGGTGRRARLRILCPQDMQVRFLSTAPHFVCEERNPRDFNGTLNYRVGERKSSLNYRVGTRSKKMSTKG